MNLMEIGVSHFISYVSAEIETISCGLYVFLDLLQKLVWK